MLRLIKTFSILLCFVSNAVTAAILIEVTSGDGGQTQIMMSSDQARIEMGEGQGYMLIDHKKQTMLAVIPAQKQIMDMSGDMPSVGGRAAPRIKTELVPNGNGPKIAGYSTKKYTLKAEGKLCGTLFGSKAAMETTGIAKLFESMRAMEEKQRAAMGGYAAMIDVCTRANMDFASQGMKVGVPMRMLDTSGKVTSEIKSINTNANFPADTFTLPKGYKTVSMADQMNSARQGTSQGMNQGQGQMPDMQQMMKQMQQSGRMSPEAIEQMKRYQEMMQQQAR